MFDNELKVGNKQDTNLNDISLIAESSVAYLKSNLIPAILGVEDSISVNLGDVVELIARDDYD
jgi:hypothetical protein